MSRSGKPRYRDPGFFADYLGDVVEDRIYIGSSDADLEEEVRRNMWSISITGQQAKTLSKEDFLAFISEVISDRKQQVEDAGHGMIFYLWFDEIACQLRFNLISDFHLRLPFESRLQPIETPELIVRRFLESKCHDGIPLSELREVGPDEDSPEPDPAQFVLPVYVEMISKG